MNNNQIIIGRTKENKLELITVEFAWRRVKRGIKSFEPTKEAREVLKKYQGWTNFSVGLRDDPRIQADMQKVFEKYLLIF